MKEIIINHNDQGQRTDRFLMKMFPSLPKGTLYKAIRNKKIKVNRKRCTIDQRLCEGDVVQLFLPPQLLSEKEADWSFLQVPKALTIVYEDAQVLIRTSRSVCAHKVTGHRCRIVWSAVCGIISMRQAHMIQG
ncbi:MAG: hypothetical protein ACLVJ6_01935 [Merdibacter sp.]